MSTDRVACLSIVDAPFATWFGLVNAGFPLCSDVRTRVGAQPTQALPERSGGLGGFAESWRLGSRGRMRAQKGETKSKLLGWNGAKRNEGEAVLTRVRVSGAITYSARESFGCAEYFISTYETVMWITMT